MNCRSGTHDALSRQTLEDWFADVDDTPADNTYATTYDIGGRVTSVGDGSTSHAYAHNVFGQLESARQTIDGLAPEVRFDYRYDAAGRLASVATTLDPDGAATADYANSYRRDRLGRVTQIAQSGQSGGNAVAEKRVDFVFDDFGRLDGTTRWADLDGTKYVAGTDRVFDALGRVTDITHERAATIFADYDLAWDNAGRLTDFDFTSLVGDDGDADYDYDATNQLTAADYASDWQTDESYTYDENGNRITANGDTYATEDHNRLLSDGAYNYLYDGEGNRIARFEDNDADNAISSGDTNITIYTWDHRNRLAAVNDYDDYTDYNGGIESKTVEYNYDHANQLVARSFDADGDGAGSAGETHFIHDAGQIVLQFNGTTSADLPHRYLWGSNVDEILADETVNDGSAEDILWPLTDHQNTVRDLAAYDSATDTYKKIQCSRHV